MSQRGANFYGRLITFDAVRHWILCHNNQTWLLERQKPLFCRQPIFFWQWSEHDDPSVLGRGEKKRIDKSEEYCGLDVLTVVGVSNDQKVSSCGLWWHFRLCSKIFIPYLYLLPPIMRFKVFYLTTLSFAGFAWPRCRFRWPYYIRRWSAAARLLALRVRIPPGSWMSVSWECSVLSGRSLCVGIITRSEDSYR